MQLKCKHNVDKTANKYIFLHVDINQWCFGRQSAREFPLPGPSTSKISLQIQILELASSNPVMLEERQRRNQGTRPRLERPIGSWEGRCGSFVFQKTLWQTKDADLELGHSPSPSGEDKKKRPLVVEMSTADGLNCMLINTVV